MTSRWALAGAGLILAISGCGIPTDDEPRAVKPPPGPYQVLASQPPHSSQTGTVAETLYLVKGGFIVPVDRRVSAAPTVETVMQDLLAGPTDLERAQGLGSALPGTAVIDNVRVDDGLAVVTMGTRPEGTGRNDEVLAFGQIVCTLDGRSDVHGVTFIYDGARIDVPRGDGSLSTNALTTADYAALLGPR